MMLMRYFGGCFFVNIELQKVVVLYVRIYAPIETASKIILSTLTLNYENFFFHCTKDEKKTTTVKVVVF
jgi:hypothetical protein